MKGMTETMPDQETISPAPSKDFYQLGESVTTNVVGAKASRLFEVSLTGIRVPRGIAVSVHALADGSLPTGTSQALRSALQRMLGRRLIIVRSSAVLEDGVGQSLAGEFDSVGPVEIADVDTAVTRVVDSGRRRGVEMGVLIQEYISEMVLGGVCFTANPMTGNVETLVDCVDRDLAEFVSGTRSPEYQLRFKSGQDPDEILSAIPIRERHALKRLLAVTDTLKGQFPWKLDVEWIHDGTFLYILQVRPVTVLPENRAYDSVPQGEQLAQRTTINGIGLSRGRAVGRVRKIASHISPHEVREQLSSSDIVVAHALRVDHLEAIDQARGIVLSDASMLSHIAIRARELGIPAVGGVRDVLGLLHDGESLGIDGDNGSLELSRSISSRQPPDGVAEFYTPRLVQVMARGDQDVLYQQVRHQIVVFPPDYTEGTIDRHIDAITKGLDICADKVFVDRNSAWTGENSPSIVLSQYRALHEAEKHPACRKILARATAHYTSADSIGLKALIDRLDQLAKRHAVLCRRIQRDFEGMLDDQGKASAAVSAADHLDRCRQISGTLTGTLMIDVLGSEFLDRSTRDQHSLDISAREMIAVIERAKNDRLAVECSDDGVTVLDMMYWFYDHGLDGVVEPYRW